MRDSVLMVCPFPPPVHGMAVVNLAMRDEIEKEGVQVSIANTAASTLRRGIASRLDRLPRVLRGAFSILQSTSRVVYMSVSGGSGQAYEIVFSCLARMRFKSLVLHHHCYAYLDQPTWLFRILLAVCGRSAVHVALSEGMADKLRALGASNVIALSNAGFLRHAFSSRPVRPLRLIGFLSNICEEKGVFEFLAIARAYQEAGSHLRFALAGPFQDEGVEARVKGELESLPNVSYEGALYGAQKDEFFSRIDLLLFPTKYRNEAEPVTIHEAMRLGRPVIAWERGAIAEILDNRSGAMVCATSPFVDTAISAIDAWLESPEQFAETSGRALESFAQLRESARDRLRSLILAMAA